MKWRRFVELAFVLLLCAPVFAAPEERNPAQFDPWERAKLIEPGKKVSVQLHTGKMLNGKMHSWSPEGLTVLKGNALVQVAKSDIAKIAMVAGMSRGRRAAWAGLIGGGIGAGIGGGACAGAGGCDVSPASVAAGAAVWIGGIAAGIAALIPQHKEVIYAAPPTLPPAASSTGR